MLVLGTNVPAYLASSLEIFFTASTPEHLEDGVLDDGPLEVGVLLLEPVDEVLAEHLDQIKRRFQGRHGSWHNDTRHNNRERSC
jgi:hypothetical protein